MSAISIRDCDAKLIYFHQHEDSDISSLKESFEPPYFGLHVQHIDRIFLISHTFRNAEFTGIPGAYHCTLCKSQKTSDCYIIKYELIEEKELYNNPHISEEDFISFNAYLCTTCHQTISESIEQYFQLHQDQVASDLL